MPDRVIVTTTTFYPDPSKKDAVRFNLALELVRGARKAGHTVVVVDGSPPSTSVADAFVERGAYVFKQREKGMGPSRRQVWREAAKFVTKDTAGILWTEPEKTDIIHSIPKMLQCVKEGAQVVVLSRSPASWDTYPAFQRESERVANLVYGRLFPPTEGNPPWDPMFGPVLFHQVAVPFFAEVNSQELGVPDTYIQHYGPIIARGGNHLAISCQVDFTYPPHQKAEEEGEKSAEMMAKRLWQLRELIAAYFTLWERFGPR